MVGSLADPWSWGKEGGFRNQNHQWAACLRLGPCICWHWGSGAVTFQTLYPSTSSSLSLPSHSNLHTCTHSSMPSHRYVPWAWNALCSQSKVLSFSKTQLQVSGPGPPPTSPLSINHNSFLEGARARPCPAQKLVHGSCGGVGNSSPGGPGGLRGPVLSGTFCHHSPWCLRPESFPYPSPYRWVAHRSFRE